MAAFKKPEPLKIKCTASDCDNDPALLQGDAEDGSRRSWPLPGLRC